MELHTIREVPMPAPVAYQRAIAYLRTTGYRRKWWSNSFMRDQRPSATVEPLLAQWSVTVEVEVRPHQAETAV
ncbi:MAG: hypothetical protein EOM24_23870, partial [Chloroflexia bacterium]|nr:hypothetical protein [Chloroflexia bacterium]